MHNPSGRWIFPPVLTRLLLQFNNNCQRRRAINTLIDNFKDNPFKSTASLAGYAIETTDLSKVYGSNLVIDGLNLRVERGRIFTLLGPNGAGKTTTINMLTTLTAPTTGSAVVNGFDVVREALEVRQSIGVTFQEMVMDKHLTGRDLLNVHGKLYDLSKAEIKASISELVQILELSTLIDRPVKTYSGGMKRRLELARGLLTRPKVLFLDEPTLGLDPQSRANLWDYIKELKQQRGLTLFLTTHYLEEAEKMADRVGIMDRGKLVVEGTIPELIGALGADVVIVTGSGQPESFIDKLRQQAWVSFVTLSDQGSEASQPDEQGGSPSSPALPASLTEAHLQIGLKTEAGKFLKKIISLAERERFQISNIAAQRPSLQDVFFKYTRRKL